MRSFCSHRVFRGLGVVKIFLKSLRVNFHTFMPPSYQQVTCERNKLMYKLAKSQAGKKVGLTAGFSTANEFPINVNPFAVLPAGYFRRRK